MITLFTWLGLKSPVMPAKRYTSDSPTVLENVTESPTSRGMVFSASPLLCTLYSFRLWLVGHQVVGEEDHQGDDHEEHNVDGYRLDLAASSEDGVGLLSARTGQPRFCDDAPDPLPLGLRDAPKGGTHVGLVDPPQDGQCLLHPVVPVEERLRVSRLHHGVNSVRHPAGSLEVVPVHGLEHLHVQIGYEATVPGED